jgi:hypothetical protein
MAESQSWTAVLLPEGNAMGSPSGKNKSLSRNLVFSCPEMLTLSFSFLGLLAADELNRLSIALLDLGFAVGNVSRSKETEGVFLVSVAD